MAKAHCGRWGEAGGGSIRTMAHRRGGGSTADVSWKPRREEALRVLRRVFGHDGFRGKQEVSLGAIVYLSLPVEIAAFAGRGGGGGGGGAPLAFASSVAAENVVTSHPLSRQPVHVPIHAYDAPI